MARWPLLAVVFLLAGCASPDRDDGKPAPESVLPHGDQGAAGLQVDPPSPQESFVFEGQMVGAGYMTPSQNGFVGIITMPQGFTIKDGAVGLTIVLTWDVPGVYYLDVWGPEDQAFMDSQLPDSAVAGEVRFTTTDVPAGAWSVMARAVGPAAVNYTIVATVDYST